MDQFIKLRVSKDPRTCVGCDHCDPIGSRSNPYWYCSVYKQNLGKGLPIRCPGCIRDSVQDGKDERLDSNGVQRTSGGGQRRAGRRHFHGDVLTSV